MEKLPYFGQGDALKLRNHDGVKNPLIIRF